MKGIQLSQTVHGVHGQRVFSFHFDSFWSRLRGSCSLKIWRSSCPETEKWGAQHYRRNLVLPIQSFGQHPELTAKKDFLSCQKSGGNNLWNINSPNPSRCVSSVLYHSHFGHRFPWSIKSFFVWSLYKVVLAPKKVEPAWTCNTRPRHNIELTKNLTQKSFESKRNAFETEKSDSLKSKIENWWTQKIQFHFDI